jgi:hypothetical protein
MQNYKNETLTDNKCKIFQVKNAQVKLAYGLFGAAIIGDPLDNVLFDFEMESARAFESADHTLNWWQYLSAVCTTMEQSLNDARRGCGLPLDTHMLTHGTYLVVGGFYGRFLKLAHIEFKHNQERSETELKNYPPGFSFPFGSLKIFELLNTGDPQFSSYSRPPRYGVSTLAQGIERVRNDIMAHYDPQALEIDRETCQGIGGRIQIATITLTNGFQWVPGFEPISCDPPT